MSQDICITVPAPQQQAFSASLNTQVLHFKVIPSTDAPWITQIQDQDGAYQALNSLSLSFAPSADLTALNAEQKVVLIADLVSPANEDAAPGLLAEGRIADTGGDGATPDHIPGFSSTDWRAVDDDFQVFP